MRYQAEQLDRAATLAALALSRYPDDEKLNAEAQVVLDEASQKLLRVSVNCDEACELAVDGKLQHAGRALSHTLFLVPGDHQVSAGWTEARADAKEVTGQAADERVLQFVAPKEQPPAKVATSYLSSADRVGTTSFSAHCAA